MNQDDTKDIPAENVRQTPKKKKKDKMIVILCFFLLLLPILLFLFLTLNLALFLFLIPLWLQLPCRWHHRFLNQFPFQIKRPQRQVLSKLKHKISNCQKIRKITLRTKCNQHQKNKDCKFRKKTFGWT